MKGYFLLLSPGATGLALLSASDADNIQKLVTGILITLTSCICTVILAVKQNKRNKR